MRASKGRGGGEEMMRGKGRKRRGGEEKGGRQKRGRERWKAHTLAEAVRREGTPNTAN